MNYGRCYKYKLTTGKDITDPDKEISGSIPTETEYKCFRYPYRAQ